MSVYDASIIYLDEEDEEAYLEDEEEKKERKKREKQKKEEEEEEANKDVMVNKFKYYKIMDMRTYALICEEQMSYYCLIEIRVGNC